MMLFESVTGGFLVGVRVRPKMDLRLFWLPLERLEVLIVTSESESESLVPTMDSSESSEDESILFELLLKIDPDNGLVS